MFSSSFIEGSKEETPLNSGKKLSHFVLFTLFVLWFDDEFSDDTVHDMLALADEYQTDDLKKRIEKFLVTSALSKSDAITSEQIILDIIEAEIVKHFKHVPGPDSVVSISIGFIEILFTCCSKARMVCAELWKQKQTYGCNAGEGLRLKIFKKRSLSSFTRRRINLLRKHLNSSDRVFRATDGSLKSSNYKSCNSPASGYRLIAIQKLQQHYHDIANHVVFCDKARDIAVRGGNMVEIISQPANYGLATTLQARCSGCQQKLSFDTSSRLETNASRHFDVNVRAVWGALASGNGLAHLNEVLATLDSPTMSQNTFTTIENEISQWWKDLLQEDFSQAIAEEKK
ncbi:unnamed protein product [Mytilus edulis]|uniref:Mutator-like transposase domain-containing protein n=1 Tax=Mytilus edulis TaxID=6550 RepID=A0A8S3UHE3_MYTED|nr:unnamed protein product [Mytilus edulis]